MKQLETYFATKEYRSYRPIPFWVWNDKLHKEDLLDQIDFMDRNAIGGFFIHARAGLLTPYLSNEWMDYAKICCEEADKRGMRGWIYDENGWPSGFAGGKVLQKEENTDQFILFKTGSYDSKATVSYRLSDGKLIRTDEGGAGGEYLNLYIHRSASTADICNPRAVEDFIKYTHEAYQTHFGDGFTRSVEGFFTDEPQYYFQNTPYSDEIAKLFREEYGEDILDSLGLLFTEQEGYRSFRYRYWKGMQKLMLENFSAKIYDWCENNGMKFTGHYMGENSLGLQMRSCGGVMPMYEYEHIPGIDWLGKRTDDSMSITQAASAAAQMGRKQLISESFACCGWDVTPGELKRIAGFQYVNGVNLLCYHMIPYSERGSRKYEYPAHYSQVNPWIKEGFRDFNTYFARLGYLLGEGTETVQVALLHPIRSAYLSFKRTEQGQTGVQDLERAFDRANKLLKNNAIAFHHLDETLLEKHGYVKGGKIGCGKCAYGYLVIPKIYTMDASTERLLRQFIDQGGKVLLLDGRPEYVEGEPFAYSYLRSTCSLEDMISAQKYRVDAPSCALYSTYRTLDDLQYLYVINSSEEESASQTFDFGDEIRSFIKVDLLDMSAVRVPLSVTLGPGEDALLFPDRQPVEAERALPVYDMRFSDARISFTENAMPVDTVRFSTDGKSYSDKWPIPALFQKLLQERYDGKLYLQYEFEIQDLPEQILLKTEAEQEHEVRLNGQLLAAPLRIEDGYIHVYDITSMVRKGGNEYTVERNWHESDDVYFALYGENVTETLINSIVYDSELQPVILTGRFGVYPMDGYHATQPGFVEGSGFYIGKAPERVSNLTVEGFPFLAREVTLTQKVWLDQKDIILRFPGDYLMAQVQVNSVSKGRLLFDKCVNISDAAAIGENEVTVRFWISNRNLLGPHHCAGSKTKTVTPRSFAFFGTWEDEKSPEYHDSFDLKLFYQS